MPITILVAVPILMVVMVIFGFKYKMKGVWIGESIALLEDQIYLMALTWLVLSPTGNPLAGITRAFFVLAGGALYDRFTLRRLMINSNVARMILPGLLVTMVLTKLIQLWMFYTSALSFGLVDAFFLPA
jgi:hypothetical protein